MKKQVLSTLALCTCLGVAQAQTDVTSQYLVNPSFEENVSYTADAQATNIKTENKIQNDYIDKQTNIYYAYILYLTTFI